MDGRPTVSVHKFSSCDGCQLAFLGLGERLLTLWELVEVVHFAEAGVVAPQARADIAFVEGSISTAEEVERIREIRAASGLLIAIGACATTGGVQALRNGEDGAAWLASIYPGPAPVESLPTATPVSAHVRVDLELHGCPVGAHQVVEAIAALRQGAAPPPPNGDKVCLECKRRGLPCVLVSRGIPCLGPVTRSGCGALCPGLGRDCYGCYGPAENVQVPVLTRVFAALGLADEAVRRRLRSINCEAPEFRKAWRSGEAERGEHL